MGMMPQLSCLQLKCQLLDRGGSQKVAYCFVLLLYSKQAPIAESQHPKAWPASTYGQLRESAGFGSGKGRLQETTIIYFNTL